MQMGNPFMGLPIFKNNNAKKHINMTELEKAQNSYLYDANYDNKMPTFTFKKLQQAKLFFQYDFILKRLR